MANKVIPADAEAAETGIIIKTQFAELIPFVIPDKEASLKIIAEKKADYALLKIDGVDDKENYDKVKKAMAEMKDTRILLTKAAKEHVLDKAKKILDDFKTDLALITDELSAVEADLRVKKDAIDDEKERIKQEKATAQLRVIQARINNLIVLGAVFDGAIYSFEYDAGLIINNLQIDSFDDQEFGEFLEDVKTAFAAEQTRLHELKLQEEKDELDRLAEIERNKELATKNVEITKKLNERIANVRAKELKLLGAVKQDDDTYLFPDNHGFHLAPMSALVEIEDGAWDELLYEIENFTVDTDPLGFDSHTIVIDEVPSFVKEFESITIVQDEKPEEQSMLEDTIDAYQPLFNLMSEHGLTLLQGEMDEIINMVRWMDGKEKNTVVLNFSPNSPFEDVDISGGRILRVYPEQYADEALYLTDAIQSGFSGEIQSLQYILLSKAKMKERGGF